MSGVCQLSCCNLLAAGEFIDKMDFISYNIIEVPDNEAYAANSIWVNDNVLVPDGFPRTRESIEKAGYHTIAVPASEFQKLDGGLSCLSLRF